MKKKGIITILIILLIILLNLMNPKETQAIENSLVFSEDITFSWEYFDDGDVMPYGLYTPSTADEIDSIPLIVWLHGMGEVNGNLQAAGLPDRLRNWETEGFSAYVLCPHLKNSSTGNWAGSWQDDNALVKVKNVVDKFISEYNVDTENVILVGHSLGGNGATYIGYNMSDYFSKIVILSGLNVKGYNLATLTDIEIIWIAGTGNDSPYKQSIDEFKGMIGAENCFMVPTDHDTPAAFTYDDGNFFGRRGAEIIVQI